MVSFTPSLRALAGALLLLSFLTIDGFSLVDARPVFYSDYSTRTARQQTVLRLTSPRIQLRSTSPPLPKGVQNGFKPQTEAIKRSASSVSPLKMPASFPSASSRPSRPSQRVQIALRSNIDNRGDHVHEHVHIHEHNDDYDHHRGHRNEHDHHRHQQGYHHGKYSKEEKKHHSKHWAEHHGLDRRRAQSSPASTAPMPTASDVVSFKVGHGGLVTLGRRHSRHWYEHHDHDHEHKHEHIHEHSHKRSSSRLGFEMARERDDVAKESNEREASQHSISTASPPRSLEERGLIGDLVKPLLAPLNIIPGFVSISDLLFGNGADDPGLIKKLGGLVLHAEPGTEANNASRAASDGTQTYAFTLMASKHERTQVYLSPIEEQGDQNDESRNVTSPAKRSAMANDTVTVKVMMPLMGSDGKPIVMCAAFATKPPSSLNLQSCQETNSTEPRTTSQRFAYTASNGNLEPMFEQDEDDVQGPASRQAYNTASQFDDQVEAKEMLTGEVPNQPKSVIKLHFTPVSDLASNENGTQENGDERAGEATAETFKTAAPSLSEVEQDQLLISETPANPELDGGDDQRMMVTESEATQDPSLSSGALAQNGDDGQDQSPEDDSQGGVQWRSASLQPVDGTRKEIVEGKGDAPEEAAEMSRKGDITSPQWPTTSSATHFNEASATAGGKTKKEGEDQDVPPMMPAEAPMEREALEMSPPKTGDDSTKGTGGPQDHCPCFAEK